MKCFVFERRKNCWAALQQDARGGRREEGRKSWGGGGVVEGGSVIMARGSQPKIIKHSTRTGQKVRQI